VGKPEATKKNEDNNNQIMNSFGKRQIDKLNATYGRNVHVCENRKKVEKESKITARTRSAKTKKKQEQQQPQSARKLRR